MAGLVQTLIAVSEKCAKIARAIRCDKSFNSLTEEKDEEHKNPRFNTDFKTLADVLIQQIIKVDVVNKFPQLEGRVYGEETSTFTDSSGQTQEIDLGLTSADTSECLAKLLDDSVLVETLAEITHEPLEIYTQEKLQDVKLELPWETLHIWTDPLDATAQYVIGKHAEDGKKISESGLCCVCILIGVYDSSTGLPVAGIINQPFAEYDPITGLYSDATVWGLSYNGTNISSIDIDTELTSKDSDTLKIVVSSSERTELLNTLEFIPAQVIPCAGVGYKTLLVIQHQAHMYILTKGSSYKWDTCGPQAILQSLGGGVVGYEDALKIARNLELPIKYYLSELSLKYSVEEMTTPGCCNKGGVIAFVSVDQLEKLTSALITK